MPAKTHGHRRSKDDNGKRQKWDGTYGSWREMKRRCLDPSRPDFRYYGSIGIQVCPQWLANPGGFEQFLADLGPRPEGYSLDRIDPDGHYEPGNCRWREALANSADNRRATGDPYGGPPDDEQLIIPKWPELVVFIDQLKSDDEEEWPF
jgi:hypothetical protein